MPSISTTPPPILRQDADTHTAPVVPLHQTPRMERPADPEKKPWPGHEEGRIKGRLYALPQSADGASSHSITPAHALQNTGLGAGLRNREAWNDLSDVAYQRLILLRASDEANSAVDETEAEPTPARLARPYETWKSEVSKSLSKYLNPDWTTAFKEPKTAVKHAGFVFVARLLTELLIKGLPLVLEGASGKRVSIADALPSRAELLRSSVDSIVATAFLKLANIEADVMRAYAQAYQDLCEKSAEHVEHLPARMKKMIKELDEKMLKKEVLSLTVPAAHNLTFMSALEMRINYLSMPVEALRLVTDKPRTNAMLEERVERLLSYLPKKEWPRIKVLINSVRQASAIPRTPEEKKMAHGDDISLDGVSDDGVSAGSAENFWMDKGELDRVPAVYLEGSASQFSLKVAKKLAWAIGFPEKHVHVIPVDRSASAYELLDNMLQLLIKGGIRNPVFIFHQAEPALLNPAYTSVLEDLFKSRHLWSFMHTQYFSVNDIFMIWLGPKGLHKHELIAMQTPWLVEQLESVAVPLPKPEMKKNIAADALDAGIRRLKLTQDWQHANKVEEIGMKYLPSFIELAKSVADITLLKTTVAEGLVGYISTQLQDGKEIEEAGVEKYLLDFMTSHGLNASEQTHLGMSGLFN